MTEDREKQKKIEQLKKAKNIRIIIGIIGSSLPFILCFGLIFLAAAAMMLPIFTTTTYAGEDTIYTNSALMADLSHKVDNWSEEEKKFFTTLERETSYYNDHFVIYKAKGIKEKNDTLDVGTIASTVHYQGTVNLMAFDEKYLAEFFNGDIEYDDEKNVKNTDTRDFYIQAEKRIGNTFMIYPGMRMMLGNLIENHIVFSTKVFTGDNSKDILSDWSLLGKITSSNEHYAQLHYTPIESIKKIYNAIKSGEARCGNTEDEWENKNICYDLNLLFDEIFGETVEFGNYGDIIVYLRERFDMALIPNPNELIEFKEYITVSVEKRINYDLYEKYLKEVYIPYIYINCDSCEHRNSSKEIKEAEINSIYDEIESLINSFKKFNNTAINEDNDDGNSSGFGPTVPLNGDSEILPGIFFNQLVAPLEASSIGLTACFGYYDALPNTTYYCKLHNAVDLVGGGAKIISPADGIVTSCSTNAGNWGPYLEITHTLKDEKGNNVEVISYYRHWVDLNGNVSCSTFSDGKSVKKGEAIAIESNTAGSHSVARHLHFGMKKTDGTLYNVEGYLFNKGVYTSAVNGTTNCDEVRRTCNEYCSKNSCSSA